MRDLTYSVAFLPCQRLAALKQSEPRQNEDSFFDLDLNLVSSESQNRGFPCRNSSDCGPLQPDVLP